MNFIYPNFLWALLLVAVPIIIHLVNLRKHKTVYFSNVSLLKKVQKETKRKSKLKQLLILTSRIIAIIALVLAFAKPYISSGDQEEKQQANRVVGIYIDNSFSMNAEGEEGKAIESAKQKAFAIVNGSQANTRFALLTNDLSELQNRFYSRNEIISLIAEVTEEHNAVQMSTVQLRFKNMMDNFLFETDKTLYYISDFQKHSADVSNFSADTSATYNFVPVPANEVQNLYIDTCWYDAPTHHLNQVEILNVRVVNQSTTNYPQVPINFYLNDSLKALSSTSLEPGEQKTITLQYTNLKPGIQNGRIEISDYPIVYDNNLHLAYRVKESLNVLVIESSKNASSLSLKALFGNDDYIQLSIEQANRLQISTLNNYSTIILNELNGISSGLASELELYAKSGGSLVIIPSLKPNIQEYNQLCMGLNTHLFGEADTINIPISDIEFEHDLFADVFKDKNQKVELPEVKFRYRVQNNNTNSMTSILRFADQSEALTLNRIESGKVYVFTFPLSHPKNDFRSSLLFLPTFYNIALQSAFSQKLYFVLGKDQSIDLKINEQNLEQTPTLKNSQSNVEIIPTLLQQHGNNIRLLANDEFDAGFYEVKVGDYVVDGFAFNYQLSESNLKYHEVGSLIEFAKEAGITSANLVQGNNDSLISTIEELDSGKQLWKLLILLSLVFLAIEAAIIKFMK